MLKKAGDARVINVVSGGMYTQRLAVDTLVASNGPDYSGAITYARQKRALMTMTQRWAKSFACDNITVNAMHPGWADTPGLKSSLPMFHHLTRHILRTPEEGADTLIWLASAREANKSSGNLFLDREPRPIYLFGKQEDSSAESEALEHFLKNYPLRATKPNVS